MKNCICLICKFPDDIWMEFLSSFTEYDIFIIVDDNIKQYESIYDNIKIIQISEEECKKNGFMDMNFCIGKFISGWDKAIYYFSSLNTSYDNIWFMEDDVFFMNENTLLNIDLKYNGDLLSNTYGENKTGHKNNWHWYRINISFPPPYYCAMVCSVRMSKKLLACIKNYADENKTLFFLEALFPSICFHNNLKYDVPDEMKEINYRKEFVKDDIDSINLFHPIKNFQHHLLFRQM